MTLTDRTRNFAEDWVEGWNTGDLERVLAHYTDDAEMTSPLIIEHMGVAGGIMIKM